MGFLLDMVKGVFIGIANIIPGVSGGTMALSLGIYDKLIGAVSNFLKDWKRSIMTLLPIAIGCAIGLVGFTYTIEFLLSKHTFVTCMAFIGLILGGLPMLINSLKGELKKHDTTIGVKGTIAFLILFAIAAALALLNTNEEILTTLTATPATMIILFFVGVIAAATMVVPGVSGSLVLMILGYYYGIIETIKSFLDSLKAMDTAGLLDGFLLLFPFGIGVIIGVFLIAKIITYLFEKHSVVTYCAILGLITASPIAIFYNTGLLSQLGNLNIWTVIFGLILAVIGAVLTLALGKEHN